MVLFGVGSVRVGKIVLVKGGSALRLSAARILDRLTSGAI